MEDDIIEKLGAMRNKPFGTMVHLTTEEIEYLINQASKIFLEQSALLQIVSPITICADIQGQFADLLRLFEYGSFPPDNNYLFLGNYVNWGVQSTETLCLLLAYKIKYPENFFMLRGNHENAFMTRIYGFYDEIKRRYSIKLWTKFTELFKGMPLAAVIEDRIFGVHGGISPNLTSIYDIKDIKLPGEVPDVGLIADLLFSTPAKEGENFEEYINEDDTSTFKFGKKAISQFLSANELDLIIRGNDVVEDGYEFFADKKLVSIFSAPNYRGEYDNAAALLTIDEGLTGSFKILKPCEIEALSKSELDDTRGSTP